MAHLTDAELANKIQELQQWRASACVIKADWMDGELSTLLAALLELQERRRKDRK